MYNYYLDELKIHFRYIDHITTLFGNNLSGARVSTRGGGKIDGMIGKKVRNICIKRNTEDYLRRMKPIAVALDKVQSDSCKLSEAVEVWKTLEQEMESL